MTVYQWTMLGIIPAALVILAGILVRRAGARYGLLFLLAVAAAGLVAVHAAGALTPAQDNRPGAQVAALLDPVLLGLFSLAGLHLKDSAALTRREKGLALALGLVNVALLAGLWGHSFSRGLVVVPAAALLASLWGLGRALRSAATVLSLLAFGLLALFNSDSLPWLPAWLGVLQLWLPSLPVAAAALLITTSLKPDPEAGAPNRRAGWLLGGRLALAGALIGYLAYSVAWASIWDQTSDGLRSTFLAIPSALAAVAAGMLMAATAVGWRRLAGLAFAIAVPLAMLAASTGPAWGVYHNLTQARADRLRASLERFRARAGRYPEELRELVPGDLWWIPGPVLVRGQGWCYQGGADFYRLGAIYREYFSTPLSVRVYASAGRPPDAHWACDDILAELKPRYDPPPSAGAPGAIPTLAPLPTSVVAGQRLTLPPIVRAQSISVGAWSPDGHFLAFGLPQVTDDQVALDLYFLEAETGTVCPASATPRPMAWASSGLREHSAWLPDGRWLFISGTGAVRLFQPCAAATQTLTERYPTTFTLALAADAESGRALLRDQESFWIWEGISLAARPLMGLSPNPYDLHWDQAAWSPGGDRLAIARLNGRSRADGATLYIVAGATGVIETSLPLAYASAQSAPRVEWLTRDELLIHGEGGLAVLDLGSDPPKLTDVLKDIFLLDVAYPEDLASMAARADWGAGGYALAVRVNHPRNQAVYLYTAPSGQVQMFEHTAATLLFWPGGQWLPIGPANEAASDRDEYELVWLDQPSLNRRLIVDGHRPRQYPQMFPSYLPAASALVFSSSQGLSLVSLPTGEQRGFWELAGGGTSPSPYVTVSPDDKTLAAIVDGVGLYYLRLPAAEAAAQGE